MQMSSYEYGFCNYTLTVSDLDGNDIFVKDDEITCDKLDELKENEYLITYENEEYGTWLTTEFEVDDDDRQLDSSYNNLAIVLEPSEDYIDSRFEDRFDIDDISRRIYEDVRWILTHDEN